MMETKIIKLPKGKYISDIEPFLNDGLETDSIYLKTVTGCGITRLAIEKFRRPLIATLPNRPVIEAKVLKHNKDHPDEPILGVYKGVSIAKIKAYLLSDVQYKKIITTPEGFIEKVLKAFDDLQMMYDKFFMLIDECERIITDVSYRGKIAAPIDHFLKFKNKAMVSATTLPFSDERLQNFKQIVIEPEYDYRKLITVIDTNNVTASFESVVRNLTGQRVCVFFNSTRGIARITDTLNIRGNSKVFCSEDSVVKLKLDGMLNAYSQFDIKDMAVYNFFTSRYFSAFDMELDDKPDVILISDVFFADHSVLDPSTEVIQIAGRLRNGFNSLTHITNFNYKLPVKTKDELLFYLKGCFDTYDGFVESYNNAVHPGIKDTFLNAIKNSSVHSFYIEGIRNSFMVDNAIHEERVKGYYRGIEYLQHAYDALPRHFNPIYQTEDYTVADNVLFDLQGKQTAAERNQLVAELIDSVSSTGGKIVLFAEETVASLVKQYPEIYEAYWLIGLKGLETTAYEMPAIKKAITMAKKIRELKRLAPYVQAAFEENKFHEQAFIANTIATVYTQYNATRKKTAAEILRYFEGDRTSEKTVNGYRLKNKIDFSLIQNY